MQGELRRPAATSQRPPILRHAADRVLFALALLTAALPASAQWPGAVTVKSCGATGDGQTDDTAAFQSALDQAAACGGPVLVDPVKPGAGYVITHTLTLKPGVSLVGAPAGMPFMAWEGVPREKQTGAVLLARPRREDWSGPRKEPLLYLEGGNTVRGLYLLYDQQPWPSDREFDDPASPYHYESVDQIQARFLPEHVTPCGPTISVKPGVASTTIEDITCGRYYDFFYAPAGGKIVVDRCYLFGYRRAFALREARDVVRISQVHIVPNVEQPISWQHAKLHAAITAQPENIAFDFGAVDGYALNDVTVFLCHTGFKLGADESRPFTDLLTGEKVTFPWGQGPWGSMHNIKLDNCVVGFDCVQGTILPNQLSNVMVHSSIATSQTFAAEGGPVSRQAAFVLNPGFAGATLQISNLSLSSFAPSRVVSTARMVEPGNGRAFLLDCPTGQPKVNYATRDEAHLEIFGLVISNIPDTHLVARTAGTTTRVRVRGFVHNGLAREDGTLP
ncbi:glycoside hydrolase family 55 protein [bacterium]|nr:glycoside hydrolase family 55 protein [bacterium]